MSHDHSVRRPGGIQPSFAGVRRFPRKAMEITVIVEDAEGWQIPMTTVDLSVGGVFLQSSAFLELGDVRTLWFRCPVSQELLPVRARVVRLQDGRVEEDIFDERPAHPLQQDPEITGMAFEFMEMSAETRDMLESLVSGS